MEWKMAEWQQDVRYGWRTLRRSPGFAAVSLLTLALAIGANTAIFSVARGVLLKPLPYGAPGALVALYESWPEHPGDHTPMSVPNFVDYRAQQHSFTGLAAYNQQAVTWRQENADPAILSAIAVSANMFDVLQVGAIHGRTFARDDDQPGNQNKAVLSFNFWQHSLGGDPAIVGRTITLNDQSYEVLGVMPRDFTLGVREDLWIPLDMSRDLADPGRTRKQHWMQSIARLKAGESADAAAADLASIGRGLAAEYPDANTGRVGMLLPLHDVMVGNLRSALLLLIGGAAMVLLIACANLANVTLARTTARGREMAVRAALGAGRGRLVRRAAGGIDDAFAGRGSDGRCVCRGGDADIAGAQPEDAASTVRGGCGWTGAAVQSGAVGRDGDSVWADAGI